MWPKKANNVNKWNVTDVACDTMGSDMTRGVNYRKRIIEKQQNKFQRTLIYEWREGNNEYLTN